MISERATAAPEPRFPIWVGLSAMAWLMKRSRGFLEGNKADASRHAHRGNGRPQVLSLSRTDAARSWCGALNAIETADCSARGLGGLAKVARGIRWLAALPSVASCAVERVSKRVGVTD